MINAINDELILAARLLLSTLLLIFSWKKQHGWLLKNLSIMAGFLLLCVTVRGYSIDALCSIAAP